MVDDYVSGFDGKKIAGVERFCGFFRWPALAEVRLLFEADFFSMISLIKESIVTVLPSARDNFAWDGACLLPRRQLRAQHLREG